LSPLRLHLCSALIFSKAVTAKSSSIKGKVQHWRREWQRNNQALFFPQQFLYFKLLPQGQ
jgi:hypothetical protein